jgi:hypothetical protein
MKENVLKELDAFEADQQWISENWKVLLGQYDARWIAVRNGRVIANDLDFDRLLAKLADPSHTCVEFITREPLEMVI